MPLPSPARQLLGIALLVLAAAIVARYVVLKQWLLAVAGVSPVVSAGLLVGAVAVLAAGALGVLRHSTPTHA